MITNKQLAELRKIIPFQFRVGAKTKTGYLVLGYIDARDVMDLLDEVVGPAHWHRQHDGKKCRVGIKTYNGLVRKEDIGTETSIEEDKGLASDSFKRACVNRGIGRFLYTLPRLAITTQEESANKRDITGFVKKKFKKELLEWSEKFKVDLTNIVSNYNEIDEIEETIEALSDGFTVKK